MKGGLSARFIARAGLRAGRYPPRVETHGRKRISTGADTRSASYAEDASIKVVIAVTPRNLNRRAKQWRETRRRQQLVFRTIGDDSSL